MTTAQATVPLPRPAPQAPPEAAPPETPQPDAPGDTWRHPAIDILLSEVYFDEVEGTRVRFPHSAVHVQAEIVDWNTLDFKAGRTLLSVILTPAQADALGVEFVRTEPGDLEELQAAGYAVCGPDAVMPAPPAPAEATTPPAPPVRDRWAVKEKERDFLALAPDVVDRLRRDPYLEAELRVRDVQAHVAQILQDVNTDAHDHAHAIESLAEARLMLNQIAANRAEALVEARVPAARTP